MHPTASWSRRPGLPGTIVVTALPPSHPCSTDVQVHVLAARDARALLRSSTLLAWREQGRPGAGRRPWSACNKKHAAEPQAQPRTPGLPCASGLRLASRSPRCTGLFGHRHPHEAKLRCEFDTSVGVSGPHDFTVRAGRRSSSAAFTSIAARLHVRDDAYAPSTRRDGATIIYFPKKRKTFFSRRAGMAKPSERPGEFRVSAQPIAASSDFRLSDFRSIRVARPLGSPLILVKGERTTSFYAFLRSAPA